MHSPATLSHGNDDPRLVRQLMVVVVGGGDDSNGGRRDEGDDDEKNNDDNINTKNYKIHLRLTSLLAFTFV